MKSPGQQFLWQIQNRFLQCILVIIGSRSGTRILPRLSVGVLKKDQKVYSSKRPYAFL